LDIGAKTVERVRQRCVEEGLEVALGRKPRTQNSSLKISGDEEAHLIALCCSQPPEGRNRWTLSLLANHMVQLNIIRPLA
jgi:Homeodomain-like domain